MFEINQICSKEKKESRREREMNGISLLQGKHQGRQMSKRELVEERE